MMPSHKTKLYAHLCLPFLIVTIIIFNPCVSQAGQTAAIAPLQIDLCSTVEEIDGSPSNQICGKVKVANDSLTDNGDGTFTFSTSGIGDLTTIGDCTTGACFDGTSGNQLIPADGTLTVLGDIAAGDILLGGFGPDIRWAPLGGDVWHLGAEAGGFGGVLFLSNVTDNLHLIEFNGNGQILLPQLLDCTLKTRAGDGRILCGTDNTGVGTGDNVTVNSTAIDTTVNLLNTTTITWAVVDGGAGGPDDAQATAIDLTCTDCLGTTEIADSYVLNSTSDTIAGTLTADGLTLGADEFITLGSTTIEEDGVTGDIEILNDVTITDSNNSPHLQLCTASKADCVEIYTDTIGRMYLSDVTNSRLFAVLDSTQDHTPSLNAIRLKTAGMFCGGTLSTTMDCEDGKTLIPAACTVQQVTLLVSQAPTTQAVIVDVNECNSTGASCTTIDTGTKPQIAAGATFGSDSVFTDTVLAQGNFLQFDIDQVGSGTTGSDLTVSVKCLF